MECALCYEKFFKPKTQAEFDKIYNEHVTNNNYDEIMKFENLLITSNHNKSHYCPTPNCERITCRDCWIKFTHNGKSIDEITEDDMPSIYDYFECPFCRQIDWKYYMKNVFNELKKHVLGEEEFSKAFRKRCLQNIFPEFDG